MTGMESGVAVWPFVVVQAFGLLIACATRLSEGYRGQTVSHWGFLLALPLVGVATVAAWAISPGLWLSCAASLSIMVLTAVSDLRPRPEVTLS
jgi:hypothetical protein